MPSKKIKFDKQIIENIPPCSRSTGYDVYYDTVESNLILIVTPKGAKTYYLQKAIQGKIKKIKIGRIDEVKSPTLARKRAIELKAQIVSGINPILEKRKLSAEMTFNDLYGLYFDEYAKKHTKSWNEIDRYVRSYLTKLSPMRLSSIQREFIRKLHKQLSDEYSIYVGNRAIEIIKAVINWGIREKDIVLVNPAEKITLNKEIQRDRILTKQELPYFFKAIDNLDNQDFQDFILLCLYTGARRSNILSLEWNNIHLADDKLYLPTTKNGESQYIALIPEAKDILKRRLQSKTHNQWVFPSDKSVKGHITEPRIAWNKAKMLATIYMWQDDSDYSDLVEESRLLSTPNCIAEWYKIIQEQAIIQNISLSNGIMDLRLHDLRRTLGSYMSMSGCNTFLIGKALNHKSQSATQRYARSTVDPEKQGLSKALDLMKQE